MDTKAEEYNDEMYVDILEYRAYEGNVLENQGDLHGKFL